MQQTKVIICLLSALLTNLPVSLPHKAIPALQRTIGKGSGKIFGSVLDPNGASIPNALVMVEDDQTSYKARADDVGEYEIRVPPGIYRITAEIYPYYQFRRAAVSVDSNSAVMINIAPSLEILGIALEVTSEGVREPVMKAPSPKYDAYKLPRLLYIPYDLLIQYQEKSGTDSSIKYRRAQVTHNCLTIDADEVRFDAKNYTLDAEGGKLVIEDCKRRIHAKRVLVDFKLKNPVVLLEEDKRE